MRRSFTPLSLAFVLLFLGTSLARAVSQGPPRVLFLGDSLSIGAFGKTLDHRMRETGLDVFTVVAGGASPYYWLGSYQSLPCTIGYWQKTPEDEKRLGYVKAVPKIESLISDYRPNYVVIQTGINLYATLRSKRRPKDENVAEVRSLIDQMCYAITQGGAKAYWILPPHSHELRYPKDLQDELASIMSGVVKTYNGAVFESQKFTKFTDPYPSTDGIHYGTEQSESWAERVAADFRVYLRIDKSYAGKVPEQRPEKIVSKLVNAVATFSATAQEPATAPRIVDNPKDTIPTPPIDFQPVEVDLTIRLIEKSTIKNLSDVPYNNALGVYEYEVVSDTRGNYPFQKIRVAQSIVFNRKSTHIAKQEVGDEISLVLVPLSKYRSLQTWQTVDDLRPNFELPLYTPKLD
jgi:hypothetical protein